MNLLLNFPCREPVSLTMSSYCKENLDQLQTYWSKANSENVLQPDHVFFLVGAGWGKWQGQG